MVAQIERMGGNLEEQEDELLALSEILPPATLTVERLLPTATHAGTIQVGGAGSKPEICQSKTCNRYVIANTTDR